MCKIYNIGGIALAIGTHLLIYFGCWSGNKLCIFYWQYTNKYEEQIVKGVPLTFYGCLNFLIFNGCILFALIAHLRASFADPGYIPKDIEVPDYIDTAKLNTCERCSMSWKPQRAHHCSECGVCVFKVSLLHKKQK
jgi:hypothetical protein